MFDVTLEAIAKRQKKSGKKRNSGWALPIVLLLLSAGCMLLYLKTCTGNQGWVCTSYLENQAPNVSLEIVQLRGGIVSVFAGYNHPRTSDIKGRASGGMVGVEMYCVKKDQGSFYRVRGISGGELWWGWVRSVDIRR